MTGWTICLGVNVGRSMATVSELRALCAKSLKYEELVSSVPKSLGPHARRKIRSLDEISTLWPTARSTAPASNRCRAWLISTRQLGQRIVAIEAVGGPKATTENLDLFRGRRFRPHLGYRAVLMSLLSCCWATGGLPEGHKTEVKRAGLTPGAFWTATRGGPRPR